MDIHSIIVDLSIIIGAATFGAIVSGFFKIPSIVGFIVAGVIIGPSGFAFIDSLPGAKLIAELGVIFLLFTIGLELSISSLKMHKKFILATGLTQLIATCLIVSVICYLFFNQDISKSIFWGFLICLSSTAIVMKLLVDTRETTSTHGKAATGILLTQDMAVIPMTLAVPMLAASHSVIEDFSFMQIGPWVGKFLFITISIFIGSKYLTPRFLELAAKSRSRELFFFAIVLMCLVFALAFERLNLSLAFGAFLSGLLISESPFGKKANSDIILMRDTFLALFFCSVGMLLDLGFISENLLMVFGLSCIVLIGKFGIAAFATRVAKVPIRSALVTGAMVFQIGEFSFVLAELGRESQLLSPVEFQLFLGITVFSMILTPFAFMWAPKLLLSPKAKAEGGVNTSGESIDVLIIGYGIAGESLASTLRENNYSYRILEHNYSSVKSALALGEPIVYGDGADFETLHEVGISKAKVVVVCVAGIKSTQAVLLAVLDSQSSAQIVVRTMFTAEKTSIAKIINHSNIIDSEELSTVELLDKVMHLLK